MMKVKSARLSPLRIIAAAVSGLFFALYQTAGDVLTAEGTDARTVRITKAFSERIGTMILYFAAAMITLWLLFLLTDVLVDRVKKAHRLKIRHAQGDLSLSMKSRLLLFGVYMLCFLPYLIVFYPGIIPGDTTRQIAMDFHLPTVAVGEVITDGVEIIYSAHHPLLTTWLFGGLTSAVSMGFSVQVAHAIGANDMVRARRVLRQAVACALGFSLLMMGLATSVSGVLPGWLGGE